MNYMNYSYGDFSFIKDEYMREILEEDYQIINSNNLWEELRNNNKNIQLSTGHSGMTYSLSWSEFKYIAKNGWRKYVQNYIKNNY